MDKYKIKLTYITEVLGAVALNKDTYGEHGGGKDAPDPDTLEAEQGMIVENEERGVTGFLRDNGNIIERAYIIKGFCKAARKACRRIKDTKSSKLQAAREVLDQLLFVYPNNIIVHVPDGTDIDNLEILSRPLRASTAQGERIALAHSEVLPVGSWMEFEIHILGQIDEKLLREWFDYGTYSGMRQWRNAGYGRFEYEMEKLG